MWRAVAVLASLAASGDATLDKSQDYCKNLTFTGTMATQGSGSARDTMGNFHYEGIDAMGNSYFKLWQCRERTGEYNPTEWYLTYRESASSRFPSNWVVVEKPRLTETDDEQDEDNSFRWRAAGKVEWPTLVYNNWEHGVACETYPQDGWQDDCPTTPASGIKWTETTEKEASMTCMVESYECLKWDRLTSHEAAMVAVTVVIFVLIFGLCGCMCVYEKSSVERDEGDSVVPFDAKIYLVGLKEKWDKYWTPAENMPEFKNTFWLSQDDTRDPADVEAQTNKLTPAEKKQKKNEERSKLEKQSEIERKRQKRVEEIFNNPAGLDSARMEMKSIPQVVDESHMSKKEQAQLARANNVIMKVMAKEDQIQLGKDKAAAASKAKAAAEVRDREMHNRVKRAEEYAKERRKRDELKHQKQEYDKAHPPKVAPSKKKQTRKKVAAAETKDDYFSSLVTQPEAEPKPGAAPTPSKKTAKNADESQDRTVSILGVPMSTTEIRRMGRSMARLPDGEMISRIGESVPRIVSLARFGESVSRFDVSLARLPDFDLPALDFTFGVDGPAVPNGSESQEEMTSSRALSGLLGTAI
jgi:hypothetical protein